MGIFQVGGPDDDGYAVFGLFDDGSFRQTGGSVTELTNKKSNEYSNVTFTVDDVDDFINQINKRKEDDDFLRQITTGLIEHVQETTPEDTEFLADLKKFNEGLGK